MGVIEDATQTQERNIEARTGKTMDQLVAFVRASAATRHSDRVKLLKAELGMGHGDANLVAHRAKEAEAPAAPAHSVETWYAGKEALRPIHDAVLAAIADLTEVEHAPKKAYLSLRRRKQFAMVGPATKTEVEVGLNLKDVPFTERLVKGRGMCSHRVRLASVDEVDGALLGWIRQAWDQAG